MKLTKKEVITIWVIIVIMLGAITSITYLIKKENESMKIEITK